MASYYVWSGAAGSANGTNWANAYTTLAAAYTGKPAGDLFYVAHDHAETTAGTINLQTSGTAANLSKIICVNRAGSVPPVAADRRATATVSTSGASDLYFTSSAHYDGIIFTTGVGSTGAQNINVSTTSWSFHRFDNCSLRIAATGNSNQGIVLGNTTTSSGLIELNNTTLSHGHIGNTVQIMSALKWRNTPSALIGAIPTLLFVPIGNRGCSIECIGVDLSAMGSGKTILDSTTGPQGGFFRFVDCKLNAAVTKQTAAGTPPGSPTCNFVRCSATGNYAVHRPHYSGVLDQETTIVRTGGASDGTTPIAWKVVTTAECSYSLPFECPPIALWNDTSGSAKTATVEGIWGGGAVPNDDEIWVDVEYLGDAASPQGSFVNDGKASFVAAAAAQTSSTATWGGSTTKFKLNVAFTAQQKGWIYARVRCGKASSTFYLDPLVTLT